MYLIVILCALGLLQFWGAKNPLHRDEIYARWCARIAAWPQAGKHWWLQIGLALAPPVLVAVLLAWWLPPFLWVLWSILVLWYALGRGEFAPETASYTLACNDGAWDVAVNRAFRQGADLTGLAQGDWPQLHQRMLEATAYQGFERLFAVLFWFLLYRLSFLYVQFYPEERGRRWLWALEWLPARLLGVSFAVTGNFVGCVNRWKTHVFSLASTSGSVLRETVLGALSVDDELMQSCDCTQREISALKRLYTRTLWFWLTCLAIWTLAH
jgi:AmpE protein